MITNYLTKGRTLIIWIWSTNFLPRVWPSWSGYTQKLPHKRWYSYDRDMITKSLSKVLILMIRICSITTGTSRKKVGSLWSRYDHQLSHLRWDFHDTTWSPTISRKLGHNWSLYDYRLSHQRSDTMILYTVQKLNHQSRNSHDQDMTTNYVSLQRWALMITIDHQITHKKWDPIWCMNIDSFIKSGTISNGII